MDLGFGIEPVQQAIEAGQNHTQDKIFSSQESVNDGLQDARIETIEHNNKSTDGECP